MLGMHTISPSQSALEVNIGTIGMMMADRVEMCCRMLSRNAL